MNAPDKNSNYWNISVCPPIPGTLAHNIIVMGGELAQSLVGTENKFAD